MAFPSFFRKRRARRRRRVPPHGTTCKRGNRYTNARRPTLVPKSPRGDHRSPNSTSRPSTFPSFLQKRKDRRCRRRSTPHDGPLRQRGNRLINARRPIPVPNSPRGDYQSPDSIPRPSVFSPFSRKRKKCRPSAPPSFFQKQRDRRRRRRAT